VVGKLFSILVRFGGMCGATFRCGVILGWGVSTGGELRVSEAGVRVVGVDPGTQDVGFTMGSFVPVGGCDVFLTLCTMAW